MANIATATVKLELDQSGFNSQLTKAQSDINNSISRANRSFISNFSSISRNLNSVVNQLGSVFNKISAVGSGLVFKAIHSALKGSSDAAIDFRAKIDSLNAAFARVGEKILGLSIGGKTVIQWIDVLISKLNNITSSQLQKMLSLWLKIAITVKSIQFGAGLISTLSHLSNLLARTGALKRIAGATVTTGLGTVAAGSAAGLGLGISLESFKRVIQVETLKGALYARMSLKGLKEVTEIYFRKIKDYGNKSANSIGNTLLSTASSFKTILLKWTVGIGTAIASFYIGKQIGERIIPDKRLSNIDLTLGAKLQLRKLDTDPDTEYAKITEAKLSNTVKIIRTINSYIDILSNTFNDILQVVKIPPSFNKLTSSETMANFRNFENESKNLLDLQNITAFQIGKAQTQIWNIEDMAKKAGISKENLGGTEFGKQIDIITKIKEAAEKLYKEAGDSIVEFFEKQKEIISETFAKEDALKSVKKQLTDLESRKKDLLDKLNVKPKISGGFVSAEELRTQFQAGIFERAQTELDKKETQKDIDKETLDIDKQIKDINEEQLILKRRDSDALNEFFRAFYGLVSGSF